MLGDMEEEEEMWPLDEFENGIKCFVLVLTEIVLKIVFFILFF